MEQEQNIIYGLFDPLELGGKLRYIGQSAIGLKRAHQHKKPSNLKAANHKIHWIKSLIKQNLIYEIKILKELGNFETTKERDNALNKEEIHLIAYHKSIGDNLTNSTEGGEGTRGNVFSQETKNKLSQKQKDFFKENGIPKHLALKHIRKESITIDGIINKHCSDCQKYKPLMEYHKQISKWDGLRSICKVCSINRDKKLKEKNHTILSKEELQQSYINRKESMSSGLKAKYASDPEYRKKNSKAKSKPVIGTSISDPTKTIEFPSALVAKKEGGFCNGYIGSSIKTGKPYKGYTWSFKN